MILGIGLWSFARVLVAGAGPVAIENLARRHQLAVLQRSVSRPRLSLGSDLVGVAVLRLGELAVESRHRATRHRPGLASPRLPVVLAVEV
jgi:hypothetical protein